MPVKSCHEHPLRLDMGQTKPESPAWSLVTLMDALALILIQLDVTPAQLSEISRTSFVKACASNARKKNSGRPHFGRVAALTGLPRSEVRRIVDSNYTPKAKRIEQLPRPLKVVAAWRSSKKYRRRGRPMLLKVTGRSPSFESLCKDHGGDIPHKAIATELLSRRFIKFERVGEDIFVRLIKATASKDRQAIDALNYVSALLDSLSRKDRVLMRRRQRIASPSNLSAAYFQNSIVERVGSFVDDLPIATDHKHRRSEREETIEVFAIVSKNLRKPRE